MAIYFTLSSLQCDEEGVVRCLCGAYTFPRQDAAYFDCQVCHNRWWQLAPGLMLQTLEKARAAL